MPISKSCLHCGAAFSVKPSKAHRKYCSPRCGYNARMKCSEDKHIGKKYGRLTVLRRSADNQQKWHVRCDCGNETLVDIHDITSGETVSCGCWRRENSSVLAKTNNGFAERKYIEPGTRFGRWTVLIEGDYKYGRPGYMCRCDCGTEKLMSQRGLVTGDSKSCGCLHKEVSRKQAKRLFTRHGNYNKPWYKRFMKHRRRKADEGWTIEMEQLLSELQSECVICGSTDRLAIDHVVPFVKGGKLVPGNAVRLCKSHNSSKHDKTLTELPSTWAVMIDYAAHQFEMEWEQFRV